MSLKLLHNDLYPDLTGTGIAVQNGYILKSEIILGMKHLLLYFHFID